MINNCNKCGLCCKTYPIDIVWSDLCRWHKESRKDILQEVSFIDNYPEKGYAGIYIEKTLRNPKQSCPFLTEDNSCSIYKTRPMVCADFPDSKEESICPNSISENTEKREKIINKQTTEMSMALNNYNYVMAILVEARH